MVDSLCLSHRSHLAVWTVSSFHFHSRGGIDDWLNAVNFKASSVEFADQFADRSPAVTQRVMNVISGDSSKCRLLGFYG